MGRSPIRWLAQRTPAQIFAAVLVVDLALVALLLLFWMIPQTARFAIDARTEYAQIRIPAGRSAPAWGDVALFLLPPPQGMAEDPGTAGCVNPRLTLPERFAAPVDISVLAQDGTLEITFNGHDQSLGLLSCDGRENVPAPSYLSARWPEKPQPPTLRFSGELRVGEEIRRDSQTARLLRTGTLTVEADSRPVRSGRISSTTELNLGDEVQFFADEGRVPALVHGLLRVEDGLVRVVANAEGREARVLRTGQVGSVPVSIAPSFLARVQAQAEWAILLVIGTLVLNILSALSTFTDAARSGARESRHG